MKQVIRITGLCFLFCNLMITSHFSIFSQISVAASSCELILGNPNSSEMSTKDSAKHCLDYIADRIRNQDYIRANDGINLFFTKFSETVYEIKGYFFRGILSYYLDMDVDARKNFQQVLAFSPQKADQLGVSYWLGLISYRSGDLETAYQLFQKQLEFERDKSNVAHYNQQNYLAIGNTLVSLNRAKESLQYYRKLSGELQRKIGFQHGLIALGEGFYREAYNAFSAYLAQEQISEKGASRIDALFYQSQAAFFAGLYPKAKKLLDSILRLYQEQDRFYLPALLMRLRLAIADKETNKLAELYRKLRLIRKGSGTNFDDWIWSCDFFVLLHRKEFYEIAHMLKDKIRNSFFQSQMEEVTTFNYAMSLALVDKQKSIAFWEDLSKASHSGVQERSLFHLAKWKIQISKSQQEGLADMQRYLKMYPDGFYWKEATMVLLQFYENDMEKYHLEIAVLLQGQVESPAWSHRERSRLYLYWAKNMLKQKKHHLALQYLYKSWNISKENLIGMHAYYQIGVTYFQQRHYSRSLGFFQKLRKDLALYEPSSGQDKVDQDHLLFNVKLSLAVVYSELSQVQKAIDSLQELTNIISAKVNRVQEVSEIQLHHKQIQQVRFYLALLYFYQKEYNKAFSVLQKIIPDRTVIGTKIRTAENHSPFILAQYWKGKILFRQGRFIEARRYFLDIDSRASPLFRANAYIRGSLSAMASGDIESVIADLNQAQKYLSNENLLEMLHVDFNLIKYNLLCNQYEKAIQAADHLLSLAPPAHHFLAQAFLEVAELYFNQSKWKQSRAILLLLEREFMNRLPLAELQRDQLDSFLAKKEDRIGLQKMLHMDASFIDLLQSSLFSAHAQKNFQQYHSSAQDGHSIYQKWKSSRPYSLQKNEGPERAVKPSIFTALYLQGLILTLEKQDLKAYRYFLSYLEKCPSGAYVPSVLQNILDGMSRLMLTDAENLYISLQKKKLSANMHFAIWTRYWALQKNTRSKEQKLRSFARQKKSISARKEALYHLASLYADRGDMDLSLEIFHQLIEIEEKDLLGLDAENHWVNMAFLEIGKRFHTQGEYEKGMEYFTLVLEKNQKTQTNRSILAETYYWMKETLILQGKHDVANQYEEKLLRVDPKSKWLNLK